MVGSNQVAELSLRRCNRCGRPLMQDPGVFTYMLDLLIISGTDNFCRGENNPPLFSCQRCLETEKRHFRASYRRKTK